MEDIGNHEGCVGSWVETWEGRVMEAGWMDCCVVLGRGGGGGNDGAAGRFGDDDDGDAEEEGGNLVGTRVVVIFAADLLMTCGRRRGKRGGRFGELLVPGAADCLRVCSAVGVGVRLEGTLWDDVSSASGSSGLRRKPPSSSASAWLSPIVGTVSSFCSNCAGNLGEGIPTSFTVLLEADAASTGLRVASSCLEVKSSTRTSASCKLASTSLSNALLRVSFTVIGVEFVIGRNCKLSSLRLMDDVDVTLRSPWLVSGISSSSSVSV